MHDWINAEDEVPADKTEVLCWYEYYHYKREKILPEYGIGFYWEGCWCGEVSNGQCTKVLYWQPLPKPPKGDKK